MLRVDGELLLSATDLVGELACEHLTTLELDAVNGVRERPFRKDDQLELIEERGREHEAAYLARASVGRRVVNLEGGPKATPKSLEEAQAETLAAMKSGADLIYQATLFDGTWRGHPDFLVRVETPSDLGTWSYEVADAKLAQHVKAAALLQCCVYSDLLSRLQGRMPERLHIVTGDGESHAHRLDDYSAYYRTAKRLFEERLSRTELATYPHPVDHCGVCRWYGPCQDRRRKDDHLSRVAGLSRAHTKLLVEGGVPTLTALGEKPPAVLDLPPLTAERLYHQARLQGLQYADDVVRHELIPPDPEQAGRGLARLPEPSALDVFLDFESHPWAREGGLEYLMGTVIEEGGRSVYAARWADDPEQEKRAFELLVDFVMDRFRRDPKMHVYHYGAYERAALRRLMGRHATREDDVDALLRGEVLVDLFEVVRQGIRVSQESYSLKKVEKLYMPKREGPSTEPGFAVVAYERWLRTREASIKADIEAYNQDDCVSTWKLRRWLEARRPEAEEQFQLALGRPIGKPSEPSDKVRASAEATRKRVEALSAGIPVDPAARSTDQAAQWLLAQLLDWHRRSDKPSWWRFFDLKESPLEELIRDGSALADLRYEGPVGEIKSSIVHRYSYDPAQEHKFDEGKSPCDPATEESAGEIVRLDPDNGIIELKRGRNSTTPHPRALIPAKPLDPAAMRDGLGRVADHVLAHGLHAPGRYRAVLDLLLGKPPATRDLGSDTPSCLPVQGPPGTGKTYTGARLILDLVKSGRRVGIVSTSHKAITNMIEAACDAAREQGLSLSVVHKAEADAEPTRPGVTTVFDNKDVLKALAGDRCQIVAGTQWLFSRKDMEGSVHALFVDEAGQIALANVVAMGGAATSFVLLGDPNQLPQVTQGTHPDGAEVSALDHVLKGAPTLTEERGLFLPDTRRLHPRVSAFISEAFYEGRLQPHASTHAQSVAEGPRASGTGLRLERVEHRANAARSREEAERVAELVEALVGRPWTNQKGETRPLTVEDIVIVAPYNAQVAEIRRRVRSRTGHDPRAGTVDKFQGQEGAVVLFSMATSAPEDAPRNVEFLYSRHRLNVAISRARALAILVCSPELLRFRCQTPEQMKLANAFCRYLECVEEQESQKPAPAPSPSPSAGPPVQLRLI